MKLVIRGARELVESAALIQTDTHLKLLINTREKGALCRDLGIMPIYLADYPRQLIAFAIDGPKFEAHLLILAENDAEQTLLHGATLYVNQEKDQFVAIWLPNGLGEGQDKIIASLP